MSCPIKNIPQDIKNFPKAGNRGLGFPLSTFCGTVEGEISQECYIALELGDDPSNFGHPLIQEQTNPLGNGWFAAPCVRDLSEYECYLAREEDGVTSIDREENPPEFFSVQCVF